MLRQLDATIIEAARKGDDFAVLPVNVYRHGKVGCSNGGHSDKSDTLYVITPEGNYRASQLIADGKPVFALERFGEYNALIEVEIFKGQAHPLKSHSRIGPMYGGNLAETSDSRFRRVSRNPVRIHDRWETQEQYDVLSR